MVAYFMVIRVPMKWNYQGSESQKYISTFLKVKEGVPKKIILKGWSWTWHFELVAGTRVVQNMPFSTISYEYAMQNMYVSLNS